MGIEFLSVEFCIQYLLLIIIITIIICPVIFYAIYNRNRKKLLEIELGKVKKIQKNMIPTGMFSLGQLSLGGIYYPLSGTSGDCWGYKNTDRGLFFWIGDVTGHGAAATMLTSTAKTALSVSIKAGIFSLSEIVESINESIYEISQGDLLMTFFIAFLGKEGKELKWINAGHLAPCLYRENKRPVSIKEVEFLDDISGKVLGRSANSSYREYTTSMCADDILMFYTDGVMPEAGKNSREVGDKQFFKSVLNILNETSSIQEVLNKLEEKIIFKNGKKEIHDDVSLFLAKMNSDLIEDKH